MMKKIITTLLITACLLLISRFNTFAQDPYIESGLTFIKSKQDQTGRITQGYSSPSLWAAIAFSANQIDINTIKNGDTSLKDFLLSDIPNDSAPVTDWEVRILAIVATQENPINFGGVNYLEKLESYYNNSQLGEVYLLNDDIFGLLALVASGDLANPQLKQDVLDFIISHQAESGGFSWSPDTTCPFCDPSADMTAAALQSLQTAKDNGITNPELDNAIAKAKNYLILNRNSDGGVGYFGTSDPDSTSWVLSAFNISDLKDSQAAIDAKGWLISNQQSDGSFLTWSGSDTTTTSYALIALGGEGWVLDIFSQSEATPTTNPSPTTISTPTVVSSSTPTVNPTPIKSPSSTASTISKEKFFTSTPQSLTDGEVLGETNSDNKQSPSSYPAPNTESNKTGVFKNLILQVLLVIGLLVVFKLFEKRKRK